VACNRFNINTAHCWPNIANLRESYVRSLLFICICACKQKSRTCGVNNRIV
jgi:hypothetical protein